MTKNTAKLERICGTELDQLLARILEKKRTEFVLLGASIRLRHFPEKRPAALRDCPIISQLVEVVDGRGEKRSVRAPLKSLYSLA